MSVKVSLLKYDLQKYCRLASYAACGYRSICVLPATALMFKTCCPISLFCVFLGPHRICPEFGVAAAVPANVNFVKLYTYAEAKTKCEAHGMQLLQKTDINNPLAGLCGRYLADEVVPLFDVSVWDQNDAEKFGSKRGVICENLSWSK